MNKSKIFFPTVCCFECASNQEGAKTKKRKIQRIKREDKMFLLTPEFC